MNRKTRLMLLNKLRKELKRGLLTEEEAEKFKMELEVLKKVPYRKEKKDE